MTKKLPRYALLFLILSFASYAIMALLFRTYTTFAISQDPVNLNTLTGVFDQTQTEGIYYNSPFLSDVNPRSILAHNVLGDSTQQKRIEVDLTKQRLYAFEGDRLVYDFLISSGKFGRTPTGTFTIWIKLRYTKMSGGSKELGTYYYLPNVPYTLFFANDEVPAYRGFGIHGTYWHNNFGTPMSHGCINMRTEEAEKIFYWANPVLGDKPSIKATEENPGTQVIIYGTAPKS